MDMEFNIKPMLRRKNMHTVVKCALGSLRDDNARLWVQLHVQM
jgi:hypothetical protein